MKIWAYRWLVWMSAWMGGAFVYGDKPLWSVIVGFFIALGGYALLAGFEDSIDEIKELKELRSRKRNQKEVKKNE